MIVDRPTEIDPSLFYNLVGLFDHVDRGMLEELSRVQEEVTSYQEELELEVKALQEACRNIATTSRQLTRRKQTSALERIDEDADVSTSQNFLGLILSIATAVSSAMHSLVSTARGLRPGRLILRKERFSEQPSTFDEFQHMAMEFQMNLPVINRFLIAIGEIGDTKTTLLSLAHNITDTMEGYRRRVQTRHSTEGIEVHGSVVATDVAISIFENVDGHGEIEGGKHPNEVSAYSVRRAQAMAEGVRTGLAQFFLSDPEKFIEWVSGNLRAVWDFADAFEVAFREVLLQAQVLLPHLRKKRSPTVEQLDVALVHLADVDPNDVVYAEKSALMTPEERWHLNFRNETLRRLVKMLQDSEESPEAVIRYVLERKHALHNFFQGENSFYVCRIGQGNVFLGDAPGALQVIPGTRPNVNLDEIFGSGYAELREHAEHIDAAATWHDLFVATSPSRTADKSNVLMVGPMGCGKSQVLRGIGAHRGSIGIFAVGSDFNTCWSGEAQKNPKRLFEEAVRLEKESKRHVHILIDEIDSVLNDDQKPGASNFNLKLEFQVLMDGVVHYPRITLWGATNNLERIPMPMIRRFAKVVIVGELDQADRVRTLRHYASPLPLSEYPDSAWEAQAARLTGATGDVVRKVIDHVWREKVTSFVARLPIEAEACVRWLNRDEKFSSTVFFGADASSVRMREEFRAHLGKFVQVTPPDIDRSIDIALDNVGIYHEIETAKLTYENARQFLAQVRESRARS
jgi:hypothetical protein